jgi:hypothetical protein
MDTRLDQAIRTLRAIRQRYETESDAGHGRKRSHAVQIALGYADMRWIAAAIEALEEKTAPGALGGDPVERPAAVDLQPPTEAHEALSI